MRETARLLEFNCLISRIQFPTIAIFDCLVCSSIFADFDGDVSV